MDGELWGILLAGEGTVTIVAECVNPTVRDAVILSACDSLNYLANLPLQISHDDLITVSVNNDFCTHTHKTQLLSCIRN